MFVEIRPLDTLFIRDSRRFGEGEGHAVDSLFPPPPSVFFGAWRGTLLVNGGYQVCKWGGGKTSGKLWPSWFGDNLSSGDLTQRGPLLMRKGKVYYPLPFDVIRSDKNISIFPFTKTPEGMCSLSLPYYFYLPPPQRLPKNIESVLISGSILSQYLCLEDSATQIATESGKDLLPVSRFYQVERRTNVGIDPGSYAGIDGRLFSLGHVRVNTAESISFICEWNGPDEPLTLTEKITASRQGCILNVGGERRAAVAIKKNDFSWLPYPWPEGKLSPYTATGMLRFRLYFATPAYFSGGWSPQSCSDSAEHVTINSDGIRISARLLAAAVSKPTSLGGYDIKKHQQRPIRRFVPAGSVFYLEVKSELVGDVEKLHATCIGDDPFLRAQGFGLAFVGKCPLETE